MKQNVSFVNYAHRGASAYAPENTLCAFYLGLLQGANGIETDVQLTKDGVPVLFHDDTLSRVTGQTGAVRDYTLTQLKGMWVRTPGCPVADRIPTLEDFLLHFADQDVTLAIELKQRGAHEAVLALLGRFCPRGKVVLTSFDFDSIAAAKKACRDYPVGWLAEDFGENDLALARSVDAQQLCPRAANLTTEKVTRWHALGYSVRAWGVADEALMHHALCCGVDGMTVNFPDKLTRLLEEKA